MPKDRYRLYHVEKAKGGLAMTMTAGSAVVAEDSPPAFGNLHAYDDEIVPWIRRDDRRGPRARRGVHDPAHPPRPAHRLGPGRLAAGRRPVAAARARAPGASRRRPRTGTSTASSASTPTPPSGCRPAAWTASRSRRTGTCSTSSGRRSPTSAPTSTAARSRTGCASAGGCSRAIRERVGPDFIVGIRMASTRRVRGRHRHADRARAPRTVSRPTG